ncbi:MAG TPA: M14 family metallopeptidase [Thermoanaerobaculia bacterium]|nr:M14 family metallopeptidase [Thermoanaerobaculia bacterium]
MKRTVICLAILFAVSGPGSADEELLTPSRSASELLRIYQSPPLPPLIPWAGKSRSLAVGKSDRWVTPAERTDFRTSPTYDETVSWLRTLVAASPRLRMVSLGVSPEGRDLWMVIASNERSFTAEALKKSGKPLLLAQAGIHAGEIDGKDAGMMLLRDMTVRGTEKALLDRANVLFVPIFNVDGHERRSRFGRINQRGPEELGWRTTARNLNLNRDYMKLDSPEMRAMVAAINRWQPDLYIDLHVTDGADYQYDITWGYSGRHGRSPAIAAWLDQQLTPALDRDLAEMGHVPGPLVFGVRGFEDDLSKGITAGISLPRFSDGYGDARHLAAVLVENHSLKPYDQRVLGTYVLLRGAIRTLGAQAQSLRSAARVDRSTPMQSIPLSWKVAETNQETFDFLGVESRTYPSTVSGAVTREWVGKPLKMIVPLLRETEVASRVTSPSAYWIPAAWSDVIERIERHGIVVEKLTRSRVVEVSMYRMKNPKLAVQPFEGRVGMTAESAIEKRRQLFPAGSVRVSANQPLGLLASLLLEPASSDSFFQWGFFAEILQRTEYIEAYVMEPMARQMMSADPRLAEEFQKKLEDPTFRSDPAARLQWFYQKTPFFDDRWLLYPVGREE